MGVGVDSSVCGLLAVLRNFIAIECALHFESLFIRTITIIVSRSFLDDPHDSGTLSMVLLSLFSFTIILSFVLLNLVSLMSCTANEACEACHRRGQSEKNDRINLSLVAELLKLCLTEFVSISTFEPSTHASDALLTLETIGLESKLARTTGESFVDEDVFVGTQWHQAKCSCARLLHYEIIGTLCNVCLVRGIRLLSLANENIVHNIKENIACIILHLFYYR